MSCQNEWWRNTDPWYQVWRISGSEALQTEDTLQPPTEPSTSMAISMWDQHLISINRWITGNGRYRKTEDSVDQFCEDS
jgi:hypothetical protein